MKACLPIILFHGLSTALPLGLLGLDISVPLLDWVPILSQVTDGIIASSPPLSLALTSTDLKINSSTPKPAPYLGPPGTVPILRSLKPSSKKQPPPNLLSGNSKLARAPAKHWYASSAQTVNNRGGSAYYSLFKAFTQSSADFSLLQTAVVRTGVPKPGDNSVTVAQTLEAGWINYPNQVAAPHLFVYFTTDGYASNADNKGGWNRDVKGWVQVDTTIYPGVTFSPTSVRGGSQYDMKIQWLLYNGNWWLLVIDRWIGYYPASLFAANTVASNSLQAGSNQIMYFGEVLDNEAQQTTTDMGSGGWPDAGFGQSAYIRNMIYTDSDNADKAYDGTAGTFVTDKSRYRMSANWNSGTSWGSYCYLGGPGAGGSTGS